MRFSPWTNRAVIVIACVWMVPRVAVGFPWQPPARQRPTTATATRPSPARRGAGDTVSADSRMTITAVGDQLVIRGDDPQKVALAYELAKGILADKGQSYRAFRLKYADATELAKVLDEWFNGPPAPKTAVVANSAAALMMIRGGRAVRTTPPAPPPPPPRVRVEAVPATDSLIIRAGTLDMIAIDRLIETVFDVEPSESNASTRPFIIGPLKNAIANEVVRILKDVYAEDTNQTRGRSGRGRPRPQPLDPSGRPKAVMLSIAADDRTNSIIGMAPVEMVDGIRKVVGLIEATAKGDNKVTQFVAAQGIDPTLLREVIDAIQVRPKGPQPPSRVSPQAPVSRAPVNGGR